MRNRSKSSDIILARPSGVSIGRFFITQGKISEISMGSSLLNSEKYLLALNSVRRMNLISLRLHGLW